MCSRAFETRSLPSLLAATHRGFTLITRTAPVLAPATLAALPSTRAIPNRDVFCVAFPINSIQFSRLTLRKFSRAGSRHYSESLIHRKRLMMDGYREPDQGALDVITPVRSSASILRFPPFGLTPIGENAHIAQ